MCTCEYMYVYKEVLSVSIRKVTHICRFAQHRFVYKWIYDMIYVHFWKCRYIQKGSKCEHSQGAQTYVSLHGMGLCYILVCASKCALARAQTDVSSHNMGSHIKVSLIWYMYTCEYMHVYREVLSVRVREGRDICEFAQHRFIYKSSDDIIHVYLWIYVFIQEVLSVSVYEGRGICGIWNVA